ncbi:MAG: rod shape-determining protein MreD [Lachnospiraceae bacterium]|nr:rod shape-determining protein MreD [Lachnospiraceae bacterium]
MIRYIVYFAEIILCYLLQTSVFSYFRVSGVVPDVILILIISVAYTKGQNSAILTGFFAGLLLDLMYSEAIGLCAILYMLVGFMSGYFCRFFDPRNFILPAVMVFSGEFIYSMLYYVTGFLLMGKTSFGTYMLNTILPRMFYTLFAALFLYPLFLLINKLVMRSEGLEDE